MFYRKILFHLTFLLEFPKFSVEWFAFWKLDNFRMFCKLSQGLSVPLFCPRQFETQGSFGCYITQLKSMTTGSKYTPLIWSSIR